MQHPESPPPKKKVAVRGHDMAYVEIGSGSPVVFLHGNPTSSYLWRNVIPHVAPVARCIAPDLIGMGDSDKLPVEDGPDRYSFMAHRAYLDEFFEAVGVGEDVTLVLHDWGSVLGFHWAERHPDRVRAIVHMEAIVHSFDRDEFGGAGDLFLRLRSPEGERLILEENAFVEQLLPALTLRDLSEEEMEAYRAPFREPGEGRRPTLSWPRQIPIDDEPREIAELVEAYVACMQASSVPKLWIKADPGSAGTAAAIERCRRWPNQREATVPGRHFVQEDSPEAVGRALADWYQDLP